MVIFLEDLHWLDSKTQGFLEAWSRSARRPRVLLLVNYRPEYQHTGEARPITPSSAWTRCPPRAPAALLDALLGSDAPWLPSSGCWPRAHRGQLHCSSRRASARSSRLGPRRERGHLPAGAARPGRPGTRHGPGDPGSPHRPVAPDEKRLLQSAAGHRQDCPLPTPGDLRTGRTSRSEPGSTTSRRRRVPLRDEPFPRPSSTPSSMPSPTKWPTGSLHDRRRLLHSRMRGGTSSRLYH